MNKRAVGGEGERAARDLLTARGYDILEMNFRRPTGEIDIVARRGRTCVFVEVKRRATLRYGRPAEAVDARKRQRIARTALLYLQEHDLTDAPVRFDIVEVLPEGLRHIEGAFDATDLL